MMPYSSRLFSFALWYCQLWAESLGKKKEGNSQVQGGIGQTPVAAVGVTDQHSQLQIFMDGPHDKIITFLNVENHGGRRYDPCDILGPSIHGIPGDEGTR